MDKKYSTIKKEFEYLFKDSYLDDENIISKLKSLQTILNSFLINSILNANINKDELIESMSIEIDKKINEYEKEKQQIIDSQSLFRETSVYCGSKSLDCINKKIEMAKRLKNSLSSGLYNIIRSKSVDPYEKENELKLSCFNELFEGKKSISLSDRSIGYLYTSYLHINKEVLESIEIIIQDKPLADELKELFAIYNQKKFLEDEVRQIRLIIDNYKLLTKRINLTLENHALDSRIMAITSENVDPSREKIERLSSGNLSKIINKNRIKKLSDAIANYCRYIEKLYKKRMGNLSCINKIEHFLECKGMKLDSQYNSLFSVNGYNLLLEEKQNELSNICDKYKQRLKRLKPKTKEMLESDFDFVKDITNYILLDQNNYFRFYILYVLENIEEIVAQDMEENDNYKSSGIIDEVKKEFIKTYTDRLNEIDNYELDSKNKKLTSNNY